MWISPKPMVDGFVKIFDEFRNGCDEKSATFPRQLSNSTHRTPKKIFLKKSILVSKNTEFYAEHKTVLKNGKNFTRKSYTQKNQNIS